MRYLPKLSFATAFVLVSSMTFMAHASAPGRADAASQFMEKFMKLPPQERVRVWQESGSKGLDSVEGQTELHQRHALVILGTDTVPYLVQLVRTGDEHYRLYALSVLCDMDRFVPAESFPLRVRGGRFGEQFIHKSGSINPFEDVTGRRIGPEGLKAVQWAASQSGDADLRLHAKLYSGELRRELEKLSIEDAVKYWKGAIKKSGPSWGTTDPANVARILEEILVEQAPESISYLSAILENDRDATVRDQAMEMLTEIDIGSYRLRGSEAGRLAIQTIKRALEKGGSQLFTSKESREDRWRTLDAQFNRDELRLDPTSTLALIADAFHQLYGEPVVEKTGTLTSASPRLREFVTFMTAKDPAFFKWEYHFTGNFEDMLHPRFKTKIERYHNEWVKFQGNKNKNYS